jgi:hypothetical protein
MLTATNALAGVTCDLQRYFPPFTALYSNFLTPAPYIDHHFQIYIGLTYAQYNPQWPSIQPHSISISL